MSRVSYSVLDLLKNIEYSDDICGENLSLSKTYDEIKEARFEEDEHLSMGIWERELKKADWDRVEQLCVEALLNKSKDLQIVGWLVEALTILDGFDGIILGIEILNGFIKSYGQTCYPKTDDKTSDDEQKKNILDWIYETLNKRMMFVPFITRDNLEITLYKYDYAVEVKSILVRAPEQSKEIQESIEKNHIITLDNIQNILSSANSGDLKKLLEKLENIESIKTSFEETARTLSDDPVFFKLMANVEKIKNILKPYVGKKSQALKVSMSKKVPVLKSSRDAIYEEIGSLANQLRHIEKHSPSYYILDMVVSWKDKNLLEIITDLKSGNSEAHELLKILLNS